ncbi:hypothetical protein FACS1894205_0430 [Alphaproteobacteria bacterium]|nr:hypothetical protein FACS1894205_0430 [Alphaproteobacteria bacterium]
MSHDSQQTILFGECQGSGSKPYIVSADFINPHSATFRCTCPSRKFPCKHGLGLLYAFRQGKNFSIEEIPADIAEKRQKLAGRQEKKAAPGEAPPKEKNAAQSQTARLKKTEAQLDGLSIAETALHSLIRDGFGAITPKAVDGLEKRLKQLGDAYLPGVQREFRALLNGLKEDEGSDREVFYSEAFNRAVRLGLLLRRGKDALQQKQGDPACCAPEVLEVETLLGHAWQLSELDGLGLVEKDARLMQLAFTSFDDEAALSFEDLGLWASLSDGAIIRTRNIRPYKAAKHIAAADSIFGLLHTPVLYRYPGSAFPRARWDSFTLSDPSPEDYARLLSFAAPDLAGAIRQAREVLKNPLAESAPFALLRFDDIGIFEGRVLLRAPSGQKIEMIDSPDAIWPPSMAVLKGISLSAFKAAFGRFNWRPGEETITFSPLSLIGEGSVFRLGF